MPASGRPSLRSARWRAAAGPALSFRSRRAGGVRIDRFRARPAARARCADRHARRIDRQLAGDYGFQSHRRERNGPRGPVRLRFQWTNEFAGRGGPPPAGPPPAPAPGDEPTLVTALQEQLGLKLDARRATVDVMVIDAVEKPAEN